ncbi:MAG TPA: hypothetical protein VJ826_05075 [Candidatus Polarisedimenticolaceae bacterium]|nr:hypothetical protein [Candidatus Polarisedimenticolaceae bacterium]
MAGVADAVLIEQLNAFMRAVVAQWTWDELAALGSEMHVEYRGPESKVLTFDLYLLENETDGPRPYLHVGVAVSDVAHHRTFGSPYMPLSNSFIYYRDGGLDIEDLAADCMDNVDA